MWRWAEVDPFGHTIYCSEETWQRKTAQRSDLAAHEAVVRAAIRDPQGIYFDSRSTVNTRKRGNPAAVMMHYIGVGMTHGRFSGHRMSIVVKWLPEAATGRFTGYVQTAYATSRVLPRLQLHWEQSP